MVPIIRSEYINRNEGNWKTKLFNEFIQEKKLVINNVESHSPIDDIFINIIKSIEENNSTKFNFVYSEFSKRKLSDDDCAWLYDDFLLFVLIIGIYKFEIDKSWMLYVIGKRVSTNNEIKQVNTSFNNILIENYNSKDNLFELIFVFQEINNFPIMPIEEINPLYRRLVSDNTLFETRSDFLKIVRLRSIDIIILKKELPNSIEITRLKQFKIIFFNRINLVSKIVYALLVICLIYCIYMFYSKSKSNQDIINTISAISGIIGLGLILFMKWISKQIRSLILLVFGYSKVFKEKR